MLDRRLEPEFVVVAAPNAAHHELAAVALRVDRHVVVDKPFTVICGGRRSQQVLHRFGLPATVLAKVGAQRPGARADDDNHLVLG